MLVAYDYNAAVNGHPVRAAIRQNQVIHNRNIRQLLDNLNEQRITIRECLISAENLFEFSNNGNNG
jgi:hypothetical protein